MDLKNLFTTFLSVIILAFISVPFLSAQSREPTVEITDISVSPTTRSVVVTLKNTSGISLIYPDEYYIYAEDLDTGKKFASEIYISTNQERPFVLDDNDLVDEDNHTLAERPDGIYRIKAWAGESEKEKTIILSQETEIAPEIYDFNYSIDESGKSVKFEWKTNVPSGCDLSLHKGDKKQKIQRGLQHIFSYTFYDLEPEADYAFDVLCFGNKFSCTIEKTEFKTTVKERAVQADETTLRQMRERLRGRIMIKVEDFGKAFYISPLDLSIHYLGRPADAFRIMREQAVGIKNSDINKIPVGIPKMEELDSDGDGLPDYLEDALGTDKFNSDTDGDGFSDFVEVINGYNPLGSGKQALDPTFTGMQTGRLLLQIENKGQAWYLNPVDHKRYFLGRPSHAYDLIRGMGLGISNTDFSVLGNLYHDSM